MSIQNLIVYGTGVIILLILTATIILTIRKSKGKDKALEFMYGLSDKMISIALDIIKNFDPSKYETIEEFETACLSTIYPKLWEYVSEQAEKELEDGSLLKLAFQYIDSDTLIKVIDDIFSKQDIFKKVEDKYGEYNIENNIDITPDNYEETEYFENIEVDKETDLEPVEEKQPTAEEIAAINPPREEEEEFNSDDISMEILDEYPKIIVQKDKNGNNLYYELYKDGKKQRVKKDYAEAHMK